jgi:hypothetical protein
MLQLSDMNQPQGVVTPYEQPRIRVGGALKGVEQPDVEARRFSSCTLPLVWWPPGCGVTGSASG